LKELYTSAMPNKGITYIIQTDDSDDCIVFMVSAANDTAIDDPAEPLRKLMQKEIKPDLIFLDLDIPIRSGLEFMTEIKKEKGLKEIPITIFSILSCGQIVWSP
jgi:CheY-like chemotaxis protein